MKIAHLCLANFYVDNFAYQENILTKTHKEQGYDVEVIASTETYESSRVVKYLEPSSYFNENGIKVTRLAYLKFIPAKLIRKLRLYSGLYKAIESFQPDIIFIHGAQFLSVYTIRNYIRNYPSVEVYVDGHSDFHNSAKTWLSKNILHKLIYRHCAQVLLPFTNKFFGVTPLRVKFFNEVYKIPVEKTELLVMGVDDLAIKNDDRQLIRMQIRKELGLNDTDIVIITGGQITERKNIHHLMDVVSSSFKDEIKLLVFGEPDSHMKELINEYFHEPNILKLGWLNPGEIYSYLYASDLAVFPGTHSVLWEECVGLGIPCIFKKWEGMEHVDIGGNCIFLKESNKSELFNVLSSLVQNESNLSGMQKVALSEGSKQFRYSQIAMQAIGKN